MARAMPPLGARFVLTVDDALRLAEAGEQIRAKSPPGSVARLQLPVRRLEALYETSFLRIFILWEDFLEESFLRYVCGYRSGALVISLKQAKFTTLSTAEKAILGNRKYVSWADPDSVIDRSRKFVNGGVHETILNSDLARLRAFSAVRNRIAHSSDYARGRFDWATTNLVGRRFPGSSAGKFLRHFAQLLPAPQTHLQQIAGELKSLAGQICP